MPFVPLVTTENEGPHLIVVGKGIVIDDDTIVFSVATSRNIENNGISQIVVVSETRDMDTGLQPRDTLKRKARFQTAFGEFLRSNLEGLIS